MPARNSLKQYLEGGFYHLYNRGVEKRDIFLDEQDYGVFLGYLKEYLTPKSEKQLRKNLADPQTSYKEKSQILKALALNNFFEEITLIAYCLMPNHFHFLLKQKNAGSIDRFINSFGTRYTMYFNKKYNRVGSLYQGVYKAVLVTNEGQLLHLSRYIHHQALTALTGAPRLWSQPSSYPDFLGEKNTSWVKPEEILSYFSKENPRLSYEAFMCQGADLSVISPLLLETE